jgi:hypothetical protein
MTNFDRVSSWLETAGKERNQTNFSVQCGVHIEEFCEFLTEIDVQDTVSNDQLVTAIAVLSTVANRLKKEGAQVDIRNRLNLLDALCDTDVTGNGVAYFAGFNKNGADKEVLDSNDSKFEDGKAVILPGGKIGKGKNYKAPDLTNFVWLE